MPRRRIYRTRDYYQLDLQLVGSIDLERQHSNLSSAIRLFVFEYCSRNGMEELSQTSQAVLVRAKRYSQSPH